MLVDHLSLRFFPVSVGDVVMALSPRVEGRTVCKRVVAIGPDERFTWTRYGCEMLGNVPNGHVWLEGDNPSVSHDSRDYGAVPQGQLLVVSSSACGHPNPLVDDRKDKTCQRSARPIVEL